MQKILAAVKISSFTEKKLLSFMDCAEFSNGALVLALIDNDIEVPVVTTFEGVGYLDYSKLSTEYCKKREHPYGPTVESVFDACDRVGLRASILLNRPVTIQELIREAKYADLIILDHAIPFDPYSNNGYASTLQDLLQNAACPVLILRDGAIDIEELVFTYNGTTSSIYAIKQFIQLFPALSDRPVSLLYVADGIADSVPEHEKIMNYLQFHYSRIGVRILRGNPSTEITNFLKNRKTAVVTFGAYGRSNLSRFFHPSDADYTLRTLKQPVFITHV
jgi:nucleotide-binding universal stress UspA family protein